MAHSRKKSLKGCMIKQRVKTTDKATVLTPITRHSCT